MVSLKGKVYMVTGAASGMGLATAQLLLSRGARVGLCDLRKSSMDEAMKILDQTVAQNAISGAVDVTARAAVAAFIERTRTEFGSLHGIANLAGVAGRKLGLENVWETADDEFSFICDANIRGPFHILAEGLKPGVMEEGGNGKCGGSIVHITSMFSERAYPKGAIFTASKHAAVGLIKAAAMEAGPRGIRVNAVLPGAIDTPMRQVLIDYGAPPPIASTPLERPGKTMEVANVIAFLLSDESSYVTGASWTVDGGCNAG